MKLKNILLGIGIVIVFGLTLWQGIEAFYPSPEWNDFCTEGRYFEINTSAQCDAIGGKWNSLSAADRAVVEPSKPIAVNGYCDIDFYCREEFETAQKDHSKVVFIVSIIVGVAALASGYFILSIEPVGSALIGSGIWSIFWGSAVNWQNFSNVLRFVILVVVLVLLVFLGLRAAQQRPLFTAGKKKYY